MWVVCSNGISGDWPALEVTMVVGGCRRAIDTAMELMVTSRHLRQPCGWLLDRNKDRHGGCGLLISNGYSYGMTWLLASHGDKGGGE